MPYVSQVLKNYWRERRSPKKLLKRRICETAALATIALSSGVGVARAQTAETFPSRSDMSNVRALAYQLDVDTDDVYAEIENDLKRYDLSASDERALNNLYYFQAAASDFYQAVVDDYDQPGETQDEFRLLNRAFIEARSESGGYSNLTSSQTQNAKELLETIEDTMGNLRSYYFMTVPDTTSYRLSYSNYGDYQRYPYYPGYNQNGVTFSYGYSDSISYGLHFHYRHPRRCHLHVDYYNWGNGYYRYREEYRFGFGRFSVSYVTTYRRPWYGTYNHCRTIPHIRTNYNHRHWLENSYDRWHGSHSRHGDFLTRYTSYRNYSENGSRWNDIRSRSGDLDRQRRDHIDRVSDSRNWRADGNPLRLRDPRTAGGARPGTRTPDDRDSFGRGNRNDEGLGRRLPDRPIRRGGEGVERPTRPDRDGNEGLGRPDRPVGGGEGNLERPTRPARGGNEGMGRPGPIGGGGRNADRPSRPPVPNRPIGDGGGNVGRNNDGPSRPSRGGNSNGPTRSGGRENGSRPERPKR